MTVEPVPESEPVPDWLIPPKEGFTVDVFLRLRDLPRHTELIDGSLIFVSPQQKWHRRAIDLFRSELQRQAPAHLHADREMSVELGKRQMPEPDVLVVTREAYHRGAPATYYFAEDVVLALEVVSPDSEDRDRETKPFKYAKAGIPYYWRVERRDGDAVVYAYELDPATSRYCPTGIFHDRIHMSVPFPVEIELTAIDRLD
ncbi:MULTISPECIES: Uma2 family endonuclease [unclassified Nocardia]|uniref:Uma2 family endonuclease n=1 Tax=unclassified Nocardia TaxID=2637762 RepID=UPI00278C3EE5|nr:MULTISPECIES: Uma2 family endonuclease [unclassified Nocardia]